MSSLEFVNRTVFTTLLAQTVDLEGQGLSEEASAAYERAITKVAEVGGVAHDTVRRRSALREDSELDYEDRSTQTRRLTLAYRIKVMPLLVSLLQDVLTMTEEVNETSVLLFDSLTAIQRISDWYGESDAELQRILLAKQLIDAYVLTQ